MLILDNLVIIDVFNIYYQVIFRILLETIKSLEISSSFAASAGSCILLSDFIYA